MKPYRDLRIVEFDTVGGVPFCAWWFVQQGATVTRIVPPTRRDLGVAVPAGADIAAWGRRTLAIDLKTDSGRTRALAELRAADVSIEGYRPGVMERLGLGPADCHAIHPALIYGRLVGWPRDGAWAVRAGHDINYLAMTGVLHAVGADHPPLNLVADLGGGALYLAAGIGAALHARGATGAGCVVDAAMTDGAAHLLSAVHARLSVGAWRDEARANVIDGGVPWYRCYATADARRMAVGAIEDRFYRAFVDGLGFDPTALPPRADAARHRDLADAFARRFRERTMADWAAHFADRDACVTPVLTLMETRTHPLFATRFEMRSEPPLADTGSLRRPEAVPIVTFS